MKEQIKAVREQALAELSSLRLPKELEEFRVRVMGKKGTLTSLLRGMGYSEIITYSFISPSYYDKPARRHPAGCPPVFQAALPLPTGRGPAWD